MRTLPALLLLTLLPALAAQADDAPGPLAFDAPVHDFGVVDQNREIEAAIPYRNRGTKPLTGITVRSGCSCYGATLSTTELAPGASGILRVRFRTYSFQGEVKKPLHLVGDDGAPRKATVTLRVNVVGGILVDRLHFGEVLAGTLPEGMAEVRWFDGVGTPFEILSIDTRGEPLATSVEPYTASSSSRWRGWRVRVRFSAPPPKGVYSRKLVVRTDHPEQPRVLLALTANVVGKVWVQSSRIYLGLLPRGKQKTATVAFKGFDETIALGAVSARARKGVLRVAISDGMGPLGPHKRLTVTVPADAPAGPLDDVIELRTEVPGEELTLIPVLGRIFVPKGR